MFMMKEFQWMTVVSEMTQSYLGMSIEVQDHVVIKECFQAKPASSPLLDTDARKQFHMIVAKLLYLTKHAHPDILRVISFLCTRVKLPNKMDQKKLLRVLQYLEATKEFKYNIMPKEPLAIVAYIDAAFVTHKDSKSHS
jgi:hypothetical protein